MIKRNTLKQNARQVNSPVRWRTYFLIVVCGLLTISGIFLSGRQHFSSMDYGMKNSRLRKQIDDLEAEKRRLLLAREISLSPAEIKKAAKKVGLGDAAPELVVAQVAPSTKEKAVPAVTSVPVKPMVVKTVDSAPAPATVASYTKIDKALKQSRKTIAAE
ncbi:MAG: hypothetical protein ACKVQJ_05440 [Pyrinomonadaceae bacterium]